MTTVEDDVRTALDVARALAASGVPIFLAAPDPAGIGHNGTGYWMPGGWQQSAPDPAVLDHWRPGVGVCALMGCGVDLTDIDPRSGGSIETLVEALGGLPPVIAEVATPSGGVHFFVPSMGVGSHDGILPGIDVKGGLPDGSSRGFAFLAPTVRTSKTTGERATYRWMRTPDPALIARPEGSEPWERLAGLVRAAYSKSSRVRPVGNGPEWYGAFLDNKEPQSQAAAERAINEKIAEITGWTRTTAPANFRQTLMRAAMTLGGYIGGGYLPADVAGERLEQAAAAVWGSADENDRLWIAQGIDDGVRQPFKVYTPEDEALYSEAAQARAAEGETPEVFEPPWSVFSVLAPLFDPQGDGSDQGLAKAVAALAYPALRYARDAAVWVKRERDVWETHGDDLSDWAVAIAAELMPLGQTPIPKDLSERTEAHWQAHRRAIFMSSAGSGKVSRKIRAILRSDHPATLRLTELDTNPEVLWAGRVPWDLRTSGDLPTVAGWVDPNTPHLRTAACAPDPTVPTPRWDAFTAAVLPDREARAWALRVLSVALSGYPDAVVPVLYGKERSGKTSLVEMLVQILGSYAHAANAKLLSAQDNSHDVIIYDLMGRRLSFVDEGPKRGHEATERLKQLTGGGSLTARAMRANPITFRPTHTLVMTTNNEPHLTDPALRARMRLIPCDSDESAVRPLRIALLGAGLQREAPGILAALMRECAAWLADRDSASITAAPLGIRGLAQEMAEGQDPVREWVQACTIPADPGTPGRALYAQHFARWHQDHPLYRRLTVPSETAFGRTLTEMGYPSHKTAGSWHRPLSVLGGPGAPLPPPTLTQYQGVTPNAAPLLLPGGSVAGPGGSEAGSGAEPANPDKPRSGPLFASTVGGLAGIQPIQHTNKHTEVHTENMGGRGAKPADPVEDTEIPHLTCDDDAGGSAGGNPPRATDAPEASEPVKERSVTKAEAARRAAEDKITKAEARRLVAEENRRAAVDAAAGEHIGLPAVATREGYVMPVTLEQAEAIVRTCTTRAGAMSVDCETSGYPVGHALYALRMVQLGDEQAVVAFDPDDEPQRAVITTLVAEAAYLHAFSATADLVPLAVAGLIDHEEAWGRMLDVAVAAQLSEPISKGASVEGLKQVAPAILGTEAIVPAADAARAKLFSAMGATKESTVTTAPEKNGWHLVDTRRATFIRYGAADVLDTAALARRLPWPKPEVLDRERLAQRMVGRVAYTGVPIDAAHVDALTGPSERRHAEASARVAAFGIQNPTSNVEIARTLDAMGAPLPRTPKGASSAAKDALKPLAEADGDVGALVCAVLDVRHETTLLGLFLRPYAEMCAHGDGRARPTVYTTSAKTGRMSCVRPNIQQMPREGGVRACLMADPGHLLISADFSGVEIRVAAALSQDPTMLQFLIDGRDLHEEVALQVFGPDPETSAAKGRPAPHKRNRYKVKSGVFGRFYGGGAPTLSAQMGVSQEVAQRMIDVLDSMFPRLSEWSRYTQQQARRGNTRFESYSGRVIHLPKLATHAAVNYAVQGSARELLVDTLVRWDRTPWGRAPLFPVHDELVIQVPAEDADAALAELVACMEGELYGVKIVAEASDPCPFWQDSV